MSRLSWAQIKKIRPAAPTTVTMPDVRLVTIHKGTDKEQHVAMNRATRRANGQTGYGIYEPRVSPRAKKGKPDPRPRLKRVERAVLDRLNSAPPAERIGLLAQLVGHR